MSSYATYLKMKGRQKFKNQRITHQGRSFASKLEAAVYDILCLMEKAGEIKDIKCQVHVRLTEAEILYIPDFSAWNQKDQCFEWYEAKGHQTPEWLIKKKLWKFYGPGPLHIFMGSYTFPKLTETIIPFAK